MNGWSARFFATTRGQIVMLLRRASRTVDELAQALDLTDNGVRSHLATLERDGLVRQYGTRRGSGKPAYTYELTPEADTFFPKAYDEILVQLLDALADHLAPERLGQVLDDVSRRMATGRIAPPGDLRSRVEWGAAVLRDMGGLPEVEECQGAFLIRGYSCPIGAVVSRHPGACRLAELLLSRVIGATVRERCERGGSPRCCFEVLPNASGDNARQAPEIEQPSTEPRRAQQYDEPRGGDPPCWQHLFEEEDDVIRPAPERP
ncbi:MAG: ArsR family transcriptional regulator [Chloroflexi bacterium]|nr:ArsR family transcriptional regulator [Chloroflexota bacterium]